MVLWRCDDCSDFVRKKRASEERKKDLLAKASREAISQAANLRKRQEATIFEKHRKAAEKRAEREAQLAKDIEELEKVDSLLEQDPAEALIRLRELQQ